MRVVITGGAGFLGGRLARRIIERGSLVGADGRPSNVERIVLFDVSEPPSHDLDAGVEVVIGDIRDRSVVRRVLGDEECSVFQLASVLSAGAEQDFDAAMRVNLDGGINVLEACRARAGRPRVIFTSSIAVFGGAWAGRQVGDETKQTPESTYGATKAMLELLVNDYTRKGFLDGRTARLPTVIIRPGKPNRAASSWCSAVFREPLAGEPYALPVTLETHVAVAGARTVVEGLLALHDLDGDLIGTDRAVGLPSLAVTAAQMIDSLRRVADERRLGAITVAVDPATDALVRSWAAETSPVTADRLDLPRDDDLDSIVGQYIEDYVEAPRGSARRGAGGPPAG